MKRMTKKEIETPSIYDKEWQEKKELGTIDKTFVYVGVDGQKSKVTARATIHPGHQFEILTEQNTTKSKSGIDKLDMKKQSRSIMKLVYGIDGTGLNNILQNKGPDLYTQMKLFAYEISGLSLSEDEIEEEKNLESPVTN